MTQKQWSARLDSQDPPSGTHDPVKVLPRVVAHPDKIRRAAQLAADGLDVDIVGGRWSGRSHVLGYVRAALEARGTEVLLVSGLGALLPLEAVATVLPPAYRDLSADDERSVAAVRDALVEFLGEGQSVVVVDDADRLDGASWGVLVSACTMTGRPIVSAGRRGARLEGDEVVSGTRSRVEVPLGELRLEVLHAVLEERLGGTLSPAVSARLHAESAGIPGLAVALLEGARAGGVLRRTGSRWTAGAVLWSDGARDAYGSLLSRYSTRVRDAVELLGVLGTIDLRTAWELLGDDLVEELEDHGLARLTPVGVERRPMIGVHPPGLAEFHRHGALTARRCRMVARAVARVHAAGDALGPADRGRVLSSLQAEVPESPFAPGPPEQTAGVDVPVVARLFAERYALEVAEARDRWEREATVENAVRYLQAQLLGREDPGEFERVFERADCLGDGDPAGVVRLRHVRSRWLLRRGRPTEEVVGALVDGIDDGAPYREILDTLARSVRWESEGLDPEYAEVLEPRVARGGYGGHVAGMVLATCHMVSGRPAETLRVLSALEHGPYKAERTGADLLRGLALYSTGRFDEVSALANDGVQQAISRLDRLAFAGFSYLAALAQIALGRLETAQDALSVVLSSGITSGIITFSPDRAIPVLMSVISTRTGHPVAAAGLLEHARQVPGATDAIPFGSASWGDAVVLAGDGETEASADAFRALVDDLRSRGYVLAADVATMLALTTEYDPELAEPFRSKAAMIGGGLYTAALEARAAVHERDAPSVERAAHALEAHGGGREALTYFTLAARLFRDQGLDDRADEAKRAARAVADRLGISVLTSAGLEEPDFTPREREVVRLVAAGRSNHEIARELFVGVRTVESHLRNIRRKSGAVTRREIAAFA